MEWKRDVCEIIIQGVIHIQVIFLPIQTYVYHFFTHGLHHSHHATVCVSVYTHHSSLPLFSSLTVSPTMSLFLFQSLFLSLSISLSLSLSFYLSLSGFKKPGIKLHVILFPNSIQKVQLMHCTLTHTNHHHRLT